MSKLIRDCGIVKWTNPVAILIFTCLLILPVIGWGQPITEGFNGFDTGTRPAGWTFNGCNNNSDTYTTAGDYGVASPSIKLDTSGDYVQTETLYQPADLQFWVKGMGTDASSALLVEEYYSGSGWNTLTNVIPLPSSGTVLGPFAMDSFSTEARFTYSKSAGNLAFDDVSISAAISSPTPSTTPSITVAPTAYIPTPSPTPNLDIYNPSFELEPPLAGWTVIATSSTDRSSEQAYAGSYSCKFGNPTAEYTGRGVQCDEVSISSGIQYTFSGWFFLLYEGTGIPGDTVFKFEIEWFDNNHSLLGTYTDEDWSVTAFDTWMEHTVSATSPVNAEYFKLYIACKEVNNTNNDAYIDLFSFSQPPEIEITSPSSGEVWYVGDAENITWDSVGISTNLDIHYSTNGTDWAPVATNIPDAGNFNWSPIPDDPSPQAVVRVRETGGGGISDESGQFIIAGQASINVLSPGGGENWYYGTTENIAWSVGGGVGPGDVNLEYSVNNGSTWNTITSVGVGSSPYPWLIPDEDSSNCLVRVIQPSTSISGQSTSVFTIASPTFLVASPSGGETWYHGDDETISWFYTTGITGNVDIDYSTNGVSGPWIEIASNQPNTGNYSPWEIPNENSDTCRVRISEIGGVSEPGISAADFTLVGGQVPQPYRALGWREQGDLSSYECSLNCIEAIDENNIWIGGACSLLFFWDGTRWYPPVEIGGNTLKIAANNVDDVWFGQKYGWAFNYNGMGYWDQSLPVTSDVKAVSAVNSENIWMTADKYAFHSSGLFSSWTAYTTESSGSAVDMVFLRPDKGWILKGATASTDARVLYTEDGANWTVQSSFNKWGVEAMTGCIDRNGNPNLWIVGECGYIAHTTDGVDWFFQTRIGYYNFKCAEALDENNVWIEGSTPGIWHYNGEKWIFETNDTSSLVAISAVDNEHVYAITSSGIVYESYPLPTPSLTPYGYKTPTPTPIPTATPYGYKTPSPTPISPICNNSFEESPDLICWTKSGTSSSILKSGAEHYDGSYSCLFESPTSSYTGRGIYSDDIPIIGGEEYIFSGWYYINFLAGSITDTQIQFEIRWYSGDTLISTVSESGITLSDFNTWEEKKYNETAPDAADEVQIYISCKETANNDNQVFIDLFNLERPPGITVTKPEADTVWYVSESKNITWESVSLSGNIDLFYSINNGGSWIPIDSNIPDSGSYAWTVPTNTSSQCYVLVQENTSGGASDISGQFTIAAADTINILVPDGGETWYQTGIYNIEWSAGPAVGSGTADLDYSTDNGATWSSIDTGIGVNSSPYPWTIPMEDSNECLIRVRQPSSGISGQSPGPFTITPPTFIVTSPAGGEYWYYGDSKVITWNSTPGIVGNVDIDYSTTGLSGPWFQIASNQPNTGYYLSWIIPNINSLRCRVRVSEVGGTSKPGISADNFTIRGSTPPSDYRPLTWSVLNVIDTECSIYTIEAWDENNIWVGGSCGVIFFWNGTEWEVQDQLSNIESFKALAADDVYAGGLGGGIYHYDGNSWQWEYSSPKQIKDIDACDPNHVIASSYANQKFYIVNYTSDGGWSSNLVSENSARNVVYLKPDLAYYCDGSGNVYVSHDREEWDFSGSTGAGMNSNPFTGILDQNYKPQLWLAGDCGKIRYYDGVSWSTQTIVTVGQGWPSFECIEALDENNVLASGGGKVYHYNGSKWIVEDNNITTFYSISIVNNGLAYALGSSGSQKIYIGRAAPTPTIWHPTTPTPKDYKSPSPTPVPVQGPISGKVYDRVTGDGIYNLYVRALPSSSKLMPGGARTDIYGNYTISGLDAGFYYVYVDSNSGNGVREYRSQWYNQKDSQYQANIAVSNSSNIDFPLYKYGVYPTPTVIPVPDLETIRVASGDYSGDGFSDIAIFRESSGLWAVRAVTRLYFGGKGDIPVSGDYDGDGTADVALFRGASGLWAVKNISRTYFGAISDLPVPADYDGNGTCDIGIFRVSSGLWAIKGISRCYFGASGDQPVSGDYDGDGFDDIAVFRSNSGLWAFKDISRVYYGNLSDTVVPGDYSGTGTTAPAIYRSNFGLWSIRNLTRVYFGNNLDQPVPAAFTGAADISIFRPATGMWAIKGNTRIYFGANGDLPATK